MIYNLGNPGPGLDQAHKCGRVKPFKGFYFKLQLSGHIKNMSDMNFPSWEFAPIHTFWHEKKMA
jgi:hypothetical protein